jgi:hypothetical protein
VGDANGQLLASVYSRANLNDAHMAKMLTRTRSPIFIWGHLAHGDLRLWDRRFGLRRHSGLRLLCALLFLLRGNLVSEFELTLMGLLH